MRIIHHIKKRHVLIFGSRFLPVIAGWTSTAPLRPSALIPFSTFGHIIPKNQNKTRGVSLDDSSASTIYTEMC
jgi:hypothetical protein